jgi:hypothetical protein
LEANGNDTSGIRDGMKDEMARMAPLWRDEVRDFETLFEVTVAMMGDILGGDALLSELNHTVGKGLGIEGRRNWSRDRIPCWTVRRLRHFPFP